LAPLTELPGVRLVSLRPGPTASIGDVQPEDLALDGGPDAFIDTAALLPHLDLVVTSDTAVAHLAGAMGLEALLLLHAAPDWRWGASGATGNRSPWYPSLRLLRQSRAGDWSDVLREVCRAARARLGSA
jgi:ADP-heptose:LPS heptosyltransferase